MRAPNETTIVIVCADTAHNARGCARLHASTRDGSLVAGMLIVRVVQRTKRAAAAEGRFAGTRVAE
jgi:hypothetical protein